MTTYQFRSLLIENEGKTLLFEQNTGGLVFVYSTEGEDDLLCVVDDDDVRDLLGQEVYVQVRTGPNRREAVVIRT